MCHFQDKTEAIFAHGCCGGSFPKDLHPGITTYRGWYNQKKCTVAAKQCVFYKIINSIYYGELNVWLGLFYTKMSENHVHSTFIFTLFAQLYDIRYPYLILNIHAQLYGFKYSYLIYIYIYIYIYIWHTYMVWSNQ